MKKAIITGITGQDGSYLAELLLEKNYEVHGLIRNKLSPGALSLQHRQNKPSQPEGRFFLHEINFADSDKLLTLLENLQPDEFYHLAAQSDVRASVDIPEITAEVTALGTLRVLEVIRKSGLQLRFYQASSSEMFGNALQAPQTEETPFRPRNPYGAAKVFAYWSTVNYREIHGMHASNGILFNHESPRRPENFVTRKISRSVARIARGLQNELGLGRLDTCRDWGYAPEYVEGMWRILQQDEPDDFILATQETHTVGEFVEAAFAVVDLDWGKYVKYDSQCDRPPEIIPLVGNAAKARRKLGWQPKTHFHELVRIMVTADLRIIDDPTCRI